MRRWIGALLVGAIGVPLMAQRLPPLDIRVDKLEREVKAVQRKVFPNGAPVQPELGAAPEPTVTPGLPASSPITDLTSRVDTLEKQIAALTGAGEQNAYRIRQLDDLIARVQARLSTIEGGGAASLSAVPQGGSVPDIGTPPVATSPNPKSPPVVATRNDPNRKTAVAAIEVPATGDAPEDEYTYAFRLFTAKFYPEAEAKLKEFVTKYPSHKRASYAQNLLGRAYLEEGKPALASVAFYDNYQKMPKGDRAPESLYWLGQSLTRLKKTADACKVYDELNDVYGAKLSADLRSRASRGKSEAGCPS